MADFNIPIIDYPGFVSTASLPVADAISDANLTVLFGSVDALTVGNLGQSTLDKATPKNAGPGGLPADQHAQRENKALHGTPRGVVAESESCLSGVHEVKCSAYRNRDFWRGRRHRAPRRSRETFRCG